MAPPLETFPASDLPHQLRIKQTLAKPKARKGKRLDPFKCPLYELRQYSCHPQPTGEIRCMTILRLFRKCANGVSIETTALDREKKNYEKSTME